MGTRDRECQHCGGTCKAVGHQLKPGEVPVFSPEVAQKVARWCPICTKIFCGKCCGVSLSKPKNAPKLKCPECGGEVEFASIEHMPKATTPTSSTATKSAPTTPTVAPATKAAPQDTPAAQKIKKLAPAKDREAKPQKKAVAETASPPPARAPKTRPPQQKEEAKVKGRVYRSIHERSWLPLIVVVVIVGVLAIGLWWYRSNAPSRLVEGLKNFDTSLYLFAIAGKHQNDLDNQNLSEGVRKEFENFQKPLSPQVTVQVEQKGSKWAITERENRYLIVKKGSTLQVYTPLEVENFYYNSSPPVAAVIAAGPQVVPLLVEKFPKMSLGEKIATVIAFGELRSAKAVKPLLDALLSEDKMLSDFACRAIGKIGESAVPPVVARLETCQPHQKEKLLSSMAMTRSNAALVELLNLAKSPDAEVRKVVLGKLAYFGEDRKGVAALLEATLDKEKAVGAEAILVLDQLRKNLTLLKNGDLIIQHLKTKAAPAKDPSLRPRFLKLMGIGGALQGSAIPNYAEITKEFREQLRKALLSESPEEIAAGAYGLGLLEDNDSLDRLLGLLENAKPEVVTEEMAMAVALGVNQLNDSEVAQKLLATTLCQSQNQHVLFSIAKILEHYHLHAVKLGLKDKAVQFLTEAQKKASGKAASMLGQTLSAYQSK